MKNGTDRNRLCRAFVLRLFLLFFTSLLFAACGGNTSNEPASKQALSNNVHNLADNPNAATQLAASVECSPYERWKGWARLSWTPAQIAGEDQRIDVTIFKDGFETQRFESSKALGPTESSYLFENVQGQALHRWRVVTRTGDQLVFSETSRFEGPICVGDVIADQPPVPVQ